MHYYDRPRRANIQSLRGNSSRPPTAAELLERAKKNRDNRAHLRAQHAAATSIQSVWRSHCALRHVARLAHDDLRLTTESPHRALRRLLFLSGLYAVDSDSVAENVTLMRKRVTARPFLISFARRIIPLVNSSAANLPPDPDGIMTERMLVKAIILLLAVATADLTTPAAASSDISDAPFPPLIAPDALMAACILANSLTPHALLPLSQWGFAVHIASLLNAATLAHSSSLAPRIADLVATLLRLADHAEAPRQFANLARRQLAMSCLAVDSALRLLPMLNNIAVSIPLMHALAPADPPVLSEPHHTFSWDTGTDFAAMGDRSICIILSHVLNLCERFWGADGQKTPWVFVSVLSSLISTLPDDFILLRPDDDDDDDDMDVELTPEQLRERAASRSAMQRLSLSLKRIVSEDTVRAFFSVAVAEGRAATIRVCQLFNFLTRREKSLNMAFQNALAFWRNPRTGKAPHILHSLWQLCRKVNEEDLPGRSADSGVLSVSLLEEASPILVIFACAYSYLLYIQDAEEMFESNWPFTIDEVREITLVLKPYLFSGLYVRPISNLQGGAAMRQAALFRKEPGLLDEVARLFSRLHNCDGQRQFRTSDDFWLVNRPALSADTFVQDAAEAGSQALIRSGQVTDYAGVKQVSYNSSKQPSVSGAGELLRVAPFIVPFSSRAKVFHRWIATEKRLANGDHPFVPSAGRMVSIRRKYIFEDAFKELGGMDVKATIRVKFIDEHGIEEAGIDGGGVFKEFMYEVMRLCFSPSLYGFFKATPDGHLYPNPDAHIGNENFRTQFGFLGRLLGKALFDGVLVDIPLASFFLSKILGQFNYPSDLGSLDPELYKNLKFLKNCEPSLVEDLGLNFTVANNAYGRTDEVELVGNGKNIAVTASNRIEYMHRVANYRMNVQIKRQSDAFLNGFWEVVPSSFVRLFSQEELQLLISGKTGKIDLDDLRHNTKYSGGYTESTPVIKWFWEAMSEFEAEDQCKLLQFVTSSPRAPLLGFSYLVPGFCIHRAEGDIRLPTASTCMNLLKLPSYKTLDVVREKLRYALDSNAGFDLS